MGDDEHDSGVRATTYTRADAVRLIGASVREIKTLAREVRGSRNGDGGGVFTFDDLVRIGVGRELLRVRVAVSSLRELFVALDRPGTAGSHPWAWLTTDDARRQGSALVLLLDVGPSIGAVMLTTVVEGARFLQSDRRVVVIDVGAVIAVLETRTGRPYATTIEGGAYVH